MCWHCSADGKYEVSYKPNVVIHSEGEVLWIPPAIYRSSCPISVKYFPFDEQKCEMKFGSWTFNADQVTGRFYITSFTKASQKCLSTEVFLQIWKQVVIT